MFSYYLVTDHTVHHQAHGCISNRQAARGYGQGDHGTKGKSGGSKGQQERVRIRNAISCNRMSPIKLIVVVVNHRILSSSSSINLFAVPITEYRLPNCTPLLFVVHAKQAGAKRNEFVGTKARGGPLYARSPPVGCRPPLLPQPLSTNPVNLISLFISATLADRRDCQGTTLFRPTISTYGAPSVARALPRGPFHPLSPPIATPLFNRSHSLVSSWCSFQQLYKPRRSPDG